MSFQLGDDQNVDITATPLDDAGEPTGATGGTFDFSVDVPNLVTLTPNGNVVNVKAAGPLGSCMLTVSHTPAGGGPPDVGSLGIEIVPTAEVAVSLVPGTPTHN